MSTTTKKTPGTRELAEPHAGHKRVVRRDSKGHLKSHEAVAKPVASHRRQPPHTVRNGAKPAAAPVLAAVQSARANAREAVEKTTKQLGRQLGEAEEFTSEKIDQGERWVAVNPWPATGICFLMGLAAGVLVGSSRR